MNTVKLLLACLLLFPCFSIIGTNAERTYMDYSKPKGGDSIILIFEADFHDTLRIYINDKLVNTDYYETFETLGIISIWGKDNLIVPTFGGLAKLKIVSSGNSADGTCFLKTGFKFLYIRNYQGKLTFNFSNEMHTYE